MGYAAVAFTELEGLAGTSFPNVGGIEDQRLYLESRTQLGILLRGIVGNSQPSEGAANKLPSSRRRMPGPAPW